MIRPAKKFAYSLADQGMVSAGNFLTIALGANFLPIVGQGKLIYIYTIYIALVLFNTAAFFSSANIVRNESKDAHFYRYALSKYQGVSALFTALLLTAACLLFQKTLGMHFSGQELAYLLIFLLFQQLVDFHRRAGYIFEHIPESTLGSALVYGMRIAGILLVQPGTLAEFLAVLIMASFPIVLLAVKDFIAEKSQSITKESWHELLHFHLKLTKWNILNTPFKWAGLHLPILLAGILHSIEAAAIVGSIRALTTFANVLLELLETFIPAWLASSAAHGYHLLKQRSIYLLITGGAVWLFGLLLIWTLGELIIQYLLGPTYAKYSELLFIIWFANGLYFAGRIIGVHYRSMKNSKLEFLGSLTGAIALIFALPAITLYGAWGAAWSLVIVQAASLFGILIYRKVLIWDQSAHAN